MVLNSQIGQIRHMVPLMLLQAWLSRCWKIIFRWNGNQKERINLPLTLLRSTGQDILSVETSFDLFCCHLNRHVNPEHYCEAFTAVIRITSARTWKMMTTSGCHEINNSERSRNLTYLIRRNFRADKFSLTSSARKLEIFARIIFAHLQILRF